MLILLSARVVGAAEGIEHRFLSCGAETRIVDGKGVVVWRYPKASRDGWVLPGGNVLLAISRGKEFPGGAMQEVTPEGRVILEYVGRQNEVDTVQRLRNGNTLVGEAGKNARLLEVDGRGHVVKEIALTTQREDTHLQQRMSRKLPNGNYLVPHLLDRAVREYTPEGKVVWEVKTPHMPFTAIRLKNGNTLIGCTLGDLVIEVDRKGKIVWQVTDDELPGKPFNDCCGVQRLPNGNTVVTAHHAKANETKLVEITREKKVVWTYTDATPHGIHHFQVLETNGRALGETTLR